MTGGGGSVLEGDELRAEYEKERQFVDVPIGCRYPDCFHCIFSDCGVDKIRGNSSDIDDLLRSLYRVGWK